MRIARSPWLAILFLVACTEEPASGELEEIEMMPPGCGAGQFVARNSADNGWICVDAPDAPLDETAVDALVANNGYLTSETDPTVNALAKTVFMGCVDNDVVTYFDGDWGCTAPLSTTNTDGLAELEAAGCLADQFVQRNYSDTGWACVDNPDTTLDEAAVDAFVANNGYADASQVTALETTVSGLQGSINTLQTSVSTLQSSLNTLETSLSIQAQSLRGLRASYFACDPGGWTFGITNEVRPICQTQITLDTDAVVVASVTGHWNSSGGAGCYAYIEVDDDVADALDHVGEQAIGLAYTESAGWESMTVTRVFDLSAGTHDVASMISSAGSCSLNGSSLHGVIIPKALGAARIACVSTDWSRTIGANATSTICETSVDLPTNSWAFLVGNGHWKVGSDFAYLFATVDSLPGSIGAGEQDVGAARTNSTSWESVHFARVAPLDAGTRTLGYALAAGSGGANLNGTGLQGFVIPRSQFVAGGSCTPGSWSVALPTSLSTICSTRVYLPGASVLLAATTGHWQSNLWNVLWNRADGQGPNTLSSSVWYIAPAHSYTTIWDTVSQVSVLALPGGMHTLETVGYTSSSGAINGGTTHWLALPN